MTSSGALLTIGVNRYRSVPRLRGCVPDAEHMFARFLEAREAGLWRGRARILLDESADRDGILAAMRRTIEGVEPGGWYVIHYSGHGTQAPDQSGDEEDALDECLAPYDREPDRYFPHGLLFDDAMAEILPLDRRGWLIFDACHSGTASRAISTTRGIPYAGAHFSRVLSVATLTRAIERKHAPVVVTAAALAHETAADYLETGCERCQSHPEWIPPDALHFHGALSFAQLQAMPVVDLRELRFGSSFERVQGLTGQRFAQHVNQDYLGGLDAGLRLME